MPSNIVLELNHRRNNPRNSEGSFVTLADGRILFVWTRYYGGSWSDHATADLAARWSSDGGRTWSKQDRIVVKNEGECNVMSVSLLRLQNGAIALFYLRKNSAVDCRPYMRLSTDEGRTWGEPTLCIPAPGYFVVNNDRVIQLKSGRILVPASFHRAMTEPGKGERGMDGRGLLFSYYSDDDGQTWRESADWWGLPVRSRAGVQEPGVVELADGRIYCWYRTSTGRQWQSWSSDHGDTWTFPEPSRFRAPCSPLSMKRIPKTGDLLAVWNDHSPRWKSPKKKIEHGWAGGDPSWGRTPLACALSSNEGKTWKKARLIETDPDHGYCYIAIEFTDDAVLLGYCCGGGRDKDGKPASGVLQDLCVRRVTYDWIYE